jgi:hypothetical protein
MQKNKIIEISDYSRNLIILLLLCAIGGIVIEATHQLGQTGRKNLRTRIKPEVKVNKKGRE